MTLGIHTAAICATLNVWALAFITLLLTPSTQANPHYEIVTSNGVRTFHTKTGSLTQNDVTRKGLITASTRGGKRIEHVVEPGSFQKTVFVDGKRIIDGRGAKDLSAKSGFRMDKKGSTLYLRRERGKNARVRIIHEGKNILSFPTKERVSVLAFDENRLFLSLREIRSRKTRFVSYRRGANGKIDPKPKEFASYKDCALISARPSGPDLLLQVYCDAKRGSDIVRLEVKSGRIVPVAASRADEIFSPLRVDQKGATAILSITGSEAARHSLHALWGILLSSLGEPHALSSDWAGRQSWTQSYRTRALGHLYQKTAHPVFAQLASLAMKRTLSQTNARLKISDKNNPPAGWASRIYSIDGKTPFSSLVGQGVIASAMIDACRRLGNACPSDLKAKISKTATDLAAFTNPSFDRKEGLYRIRHGGAFKHDGVHAPWNWQMIFLPVLEEAARASNDPALKKRSRLVGRNFLRSFELHPKGALFRYWPQSFYDGWTKAEKRSVNNPVQRPRPARRYEDVSHGSLSLLGLSESAAFDDMPKNYREAVSKRLNRVLRKAPFIDKDIDGKGPSGPRFYPTTGFTRFGTKRLRQAYATSFPGVTSSGRMLTNAMLMDPKKPHDLTLKVLACSKTACREDRRYRMTSLDEIVTKNPLFSIREIGR
ncbi:MAG: hypothetical protein AAGE61_21985 [Pseudomonadota bacterium]